MVQRKPEPCVFAATSCHLMIIGLKINEIWVWKGSLSTQALKSSKKRFFKEQKHEIWEGSWRLRGAFWGPPSGGLLIVIAQVWGPSGGLLAPLGRPRPSRGVQGPSGNPLGPSGSLLGPSGSLLGPPVNSLGPPEALGCIKNMFFIVFFACRSRKAL